MLIKIRGQEIMEPRARLLNLCIIDGESGCWNWKSSKRNGYGRLVIGSRTDNTRKTVSAHRYSFEVFRNQKIPDGLFVCHTCDNPACINPDHLFIGTRQDNTDDREAKGRNNPLRGESKNNAKLSELNVIAMRKLRLSGLSFGKIALIYGVHKKTAMDAIKSKNWAHIVQPPI